MIVIGSKAFTFRLEQTEEVMARTKRSDYDVLMSFNEFSDWRKTYAEHLVSFYPRSESKYKVIVQKDGEKKQYEIELLSKNSSSSLLAANVQEVCDQVVKGFLGEEMHALSLPYLALTKRSHLIYPIHFEKNIKDYHIMKSMLGEYEKTPLMTEYYSLRFEETKERNKQKTPKLNVTNEQFFSSSLAVKHYFIHDDIHEVMKHHDKPVYEMMKRDFSLAKCEKDMFFSLPYSHQVQAVQEEAYTIALERYIVPQSVEDWHDYFASYKRAAKRICTTLCSGWFRSFAIENYDKVLEWYDPNFVDKFKLAVDKGEIHPIEGKRIEEVPLLTT